MIRRSLNLMALCAGVLLVPPQARAQQDSAAQAREIVRDAYVYAFPMVLEDVSIAQTTNFAEPTGIPGQGPFNRFSHGRAFPDADFKVIVRANVDTLYSVASLDLAAEPVVLSVPATDRYFMLPMLSLWSDVFAVPGTRTTGRNVARDFLVVSPTWQGTAPAGLEIIRSPTRLVSILGRTQTNGVSDYQTVHKIQEGFKITPLSGWGKPGYVPPKGKVDPMIDMKTPPPEQVERMDAAAFFGRFSSLLKDNPPGPFDYPLIHRLERLGFKVGHAFDLGAAAPEIRQAFEAGTTDGRALVLSEGRKAAGQGSSGWVYSARGGGAYGVDYVYRAAIAQCCLGYNLPQDALYPSISTDGDGRQLDGNNKYVLHFDKGSFPPVDAFWSVTAYDGEGFFIPNALKRQALGDRDKLAINPDGSLDLLIQAESPGPDKEAKWLPVTKAPFNLLMRLYSPRAEVLDRNWTPPLVKRVN
jgi:hypothetical protein